VAEPPLYVFTDAPDAIAKDAAVCRIYNKVHKQATRQRIIETAVHRFKHDGIDGSGIAPLMADAGLTNGAFYAHFSSKDDLVAHVVADQLDTQAESFRALQPGRAGLKGFLREYLSPQHRDNPEDGCPSAALIDEIARCPAGTKHAYTDGAQAILDEIAARLAPEDPQSARANALGLTRWRWGRCRCPALCLTRRSPTRCSNRASRTPACSLAENCRSTGRRP
jgi:TetR/AcrR family transcriptional regulator, transcriptional repressor for nem operon